MFLGSIVGQEANLKYNQNISEYSRFSYGI
jgi:hypothetical protein